MRSSIFIGALALGVLGTSMANAGTIEIYLKQTGGAHPTGATLVASGPSTDYVVFSGAFGDFSLNGVSGVDVGGQLDSSTGNSGTNAGARGATLYVDVLEIAIPVAATSDFTSAFTSNDLPKGWTVTEKTLYGVGSGAVILSTSPQFTGLDTSSGVVNDFVTTSPNVIQEIYKITLSSTAKIGTGQSDLSTIKLSYTAVPETATWVMLGAGFAATGLLGVARRRKAARYAI